MLGQFNADGIKVECETDSSNLWIVDAEGVYIEQSALHSYMQEECLNAINAKYGTNFTTLTMLKVTSIAIGDDCPNWNAYEKIELPIDQKLAIGMNDNSAFSIGRLIGTEFYITVKTSNRGYWTNDEGRITSLGGPTSEAGGDYIKGLLENKGYTISEIKDNIVQYEIGEIIEDWNAYEKLMQ